ncbi:MAG: hypothetical protein GQ574_16300 [Crocinitomix sp.]|nr:hypothetical protein [Crocinitomix sp.]
MDTLEILIQELDEAEKLLSQFSGGYSGDFMSAEEFHEALKTHIIVLKKGDLTVLDDLWFWFAPTCAWDDFVGMEGQDLGNSIFAKLSRLRK